MYPHLIFVLCLINSTLHQHLFSQISSSVDLSESSPEVKVTRASITPDDSFNVISNSSVRLIEVVGYGERYGDISKSNVQNESKVIVNEMIQLTANGG